MSVLLIDANRRTDIDRAESKNVVGTLIDEIQLRLEPIEELVPIPGNDLAVVSVSQLSTQLPRSLLR
jgi:hypothetical protein